MRVFKSDKLFNWLTENENANTQQKINKIREYYGVEGISYTFYKDEIEFKEAQLNISIDDYEDENNREQIYYEIELNGSHQESVKDCGEAFRLYNELINFMEE